MLAIDQTSVFGVRVSMEDFQLSRVRQIPPIQSLHPASWGIEDR
jgi:hypothetical protein